ncbi:MAG: GIY-YIG nuclease family protein [Nitrospirae bacterium]|nr:GIY-YIG nuclease family protein [Nitrospirota bacterium]
MKQYYVYIMASKKNGTLYTGATSDLIKLVCEHKSDIKEGFTKRYNAHTRLYYETSNDIKVVIEREKQIKTWKRQ